MGTPVKEPTLDDVLKEMTAPSQRTYLFVPAKGLDMKSEYPELATIHEFSLLTNTEIVFCWLLGNKTSPLSLDFQWKGVRAEAVEQALKLSGYLRYLDEKTIREYTKLKFESKVQNGINRMKLFNPSFRMKAKMMSEKMMDNISRMVDVSEEELDKMDIGGKKEYADLVKKVTDVMDNLIVSNEEAYGVKEVKRGKKKDEGGQQPTLMDLVMQTS